ncbi:MAG: lipid-A-disaccharide synthase [Desulfobacterales bacterium]|nr:MAG: lipid-A-disaccharide synthase [Desulfobacterales bacterium]
MDGNPASKCVAIIAGETSGDLHGSKLVHSMQRKHDRLFFCGIGGPALRGAGVRILVDAADLAVVGITEVFSRMAGIYRAMSAVKRLLKSLKPDLLILIDFPDFNLHVAGTAKKLGIPVLYYISPQIWAWRQGRVKRIARRVDHMAVILPFEEDFYRAHNVPVTFVGHPLLDIQLPPRHTSPEPAAGNPPVIGLVPGSREMEVEKHLPVMLHAAHLLRDRWPQTKFIVSRAPSVDRRRLETIVDGCAEALDVEIIPDRVEEVFARCDLIVAASGTVTLQAAIHGTPMVIIYKVSPLSYWLGRALIRVNHIGLVNLVAGRQIVPELVQDRASAAEIAGTVAEMLSDTDGLKRLREELIQIRHRLGGAGASERVADIALGML